MKDIRNILNILKGQGANNEYVNCVYAGLCNFCFVTDLGLE
jgi:hypothetical protein